MQFEPLKYFESLYPENTREKELHALAPLIAKGLSTQAVGIPGVGKSNILRLLAYNVGVRTKHFGEYEKVMHFVYLDSSEVKGQPLFDITKFILLSLAFSLGERRMTEESKRVNELLKEGVAMQDELILFQSLKQALDYLSIEKKLTIHLLFDRFDSLLPTIDAQFFTNLRVLRNHAKYRFGSTFALTRPLEDVTEHNMLSDFHDIVAGNNVYVSLYDPVGISFRLAYIEKASHKQIADKAKEEVLKLTGGHAKLTKLSYEALISETDEIADLQAFLLKRATIQGALFEIWNALLPAEQLELKGNDFSDTFEFLLNSYLIENGEIKIPLLSIFIKNTPVSSIDKITYDEVKNEIYVGITPTSDKLSPSEFKLLRYLIENKERLCTKDEIINSVWNDTKTQEGVTDQALDQIFYRLRKKIEKDPANPHFIHTIKGKGYKLSD